MTTLLNHQTKCAKTCLIYFRIEPISLWTDRMISYMTHCNVTWFSLNFLWISRNTLADIKVNVWNISTLDVLEWFAVAINTKLAVPSLKVTIQTWWELITIVAIFCPPICQPITLYWTEACNSQLLKLSLQLKLAVLMLSWHLIISVIYFFKNNIGSFTSLLSPFWIQRNITIFYQIKQCSSKIFSFAIFKW